MEKTKTLDILKTAILLEKRGNAFYLKVAEQTEDTEVKDIFRTLADEEMLHLNFLYDKFQEFDKDKKFNKTDFTKAEEKEIAKKVLSPELKEKIASASFEAAAISAAIDMENKAISIYTERAENAEDPEEKEFYQWLADWEKSHHKLLYELDEELKKKVWFDNNFWPF